MQDCVRSMLNIVRIIYDAVKRLETVELPPKIEELYEPLGDVDDCIYFQRDVQNFGNADIKVIRIFNDFVSGVSFTFSLAHLPFLNEIFFFSRISSTSFYSSNHSFYCGYT